MDKIRQNTNAPMNTLKPQPGQSSAYNPKFHPLPGDWAKEQMESKHYARSNKPVANREDTPIEKALRAEAQQHEYWEKWQGVRPGRAVYENPRELQNTLLPSAKYGTEGRGYG